MNKNTPSTSQTATKSYLKQPASIGAVIKRIVKQKQISRAELAARLNIPENSVYRLYSMRHNTVLNLLRFSKALDENLLLEYHPDIAPKPNPLEAENIALKTENAQLKQKLETLQTAAEENKILKAQLEVLKDVMRPRSSASEV